MRLAVVLEGGGAKGAYQVGVLKALDDAPDVEIVAVSGASIGALNAAFFREEISNNSKGCGGGFDAGTC